MTEIRLAPDQLEQLADLLADRLRDARRADTPANLTALELAKRMGVTRDYVYRHAEELGAVRLGGPKGRLRFPAPSPVAEPSTRVEISRRRELSRRRDIAPVDLLPIVGREAA